MNFEDLMKAIEHEMPHPYTESYIMGFEHATEKMTKAIVEALGMEASEKVLAVLKRYKAEALNEQ